MSYRSYGSAPGIGSVGQYQMSGRVWITGSTYMATSSNGVANAEQTITFPAVAKSFVVINRSAASIYVHFASRATASVITGHHYVSLPNQDDEFRFDVRTKKVYISLASSPNTGSFELLAELTGIDEMHALTGSGIDTFVD
jgi:hypothetical protein